MRKTPIVLLLAGLALVASPRSSSAQDPISAHVPFSFVVDGHVLPPGDYTAVRDSSVSDHTLILQSQDGRHTAVALFDYSGSAGLNTPVTFRFAMIGGRHYLSEITDSGVGYRLEVPSRATVNETRKGDD